MKKYIIPQTETVAFTLERVINSPSQNHGQGQQASPRTGGIAPGF